MANDNIGVVLCPIMNELSAVRRDCRGKLYYYSQAGKIAPNLPQGQQWLEKNTIFVADDPARFEFKEFMRGAPPVIEDSAHVNPRTKPTPVQEQPKPAQTAPQIEKPKKKKAVNWGLLGVFDDEK